MVETICIKTGRKASQLYRIPGVNYFSGQIAYIQIDNCATVNDWRSEQVNIAMPSLSIKIM